MVWNIGYFQGEAACLGRKKVEHLMVLVLRRQACKEW